MRDPTVFGNVAGSAPSHPHLTPMLFAGLYKGVTDTLEHVWEECGIIAIGAVHVAEYRQQCPTLSVSSRLPPGFSAQLRLAALISSLVALYHSLRIADARLTVQYSQVSQFSSCSCNPTQLLTVYLNFRQQFSSARLLN